MGDENPIRTLGDYSKPSHKGYRNTIELPIGNNVVPLRSNTIWTAKLRNDILMFQQHHEESLSEAWTHFKDLVQNVPHHGIDLWLQNDPRDFAKPVKAMALPQDVPSTFDRHLIEFENQVQRLMEAHLASTQTTHVNKITTLCEICSGPHNTQYCMDDFEKANVDYASSRTNEIGGNSMAPKSIATISHVEREELKKKGIKSPSKLFSPKYLSPASIKELDKNLSAPKRVHFVNSIVILNKDNDTEEGVSSTNACKHDLGKMMRGDEEVKKQGRGKMKWKPTWKLKRCLKKKKVNLKLMRK
ncbi:hypothetical protein Tco_0850540 [Tanacetum coccineum]